MEAQAYPAPPVTHSDSIEQTLTTRVATRTPRVTDLSVTITAGIEKLSATATKTGTTPAPTVDDSEASSSTGAAARITGAAQWVVGGDGGCCTCGCIKDLLEAYVTDFGTPDRIRSTRWHSPRRQPQRTEYRMKPFSYQRLINATSRDPQFTRSAQRPQRFPLYLNVRGGIHTLFVFWGSIRSRLAYAVYSQVVPNALQC